MDFDFAHCMLTTKGRIGHTSRVLFMEQSPDGCTVASAAGDVDESLRSGKPVQVGEYTLVPLFSRKLTKGVPVIPSGGHVQVGKSFAKAVAGEAGEKVESSGVVFDFQKRRFLVEAAWHGCLLLGRASNLFHLFNLHKVIAKEEFKGIQVRYVGGLHVLLSGANLGKVTELLEAGSLGWGVFNIIGGRFGKVIHVSDTDLNDCNMARNCVGLLVDQWAKIEGSFSVKWDDRIFSRGVKEVHKD
ncbi:hypothetical protein SSX86_001951 [Deinandra increscens subsp. villosa]|uniref:Uncharacterized protein n=1 Tax=Deinandra increscens subsp. villosa TaxID=3103831 RepID=A0AAP0DTI4_9ASTR